MTPEQIRRVVTETLARYETHFREPDKVLEFLHDEAEWWIAGSTPISGSNGKAQMLETLRNLPNLTDNGMKIWPTSFIIEGERAAVEGKSHMTLKTGAVYANQYHWLFEFRDGLIFRAKEYLDTALVVELFSAPGAPDVSSPEPHRPR